MKKIYALILFSILLLGADSSSNAQGSWDRSLTFTGSGRTFPSTFTIGTDVYIGIGLTSVAPQTAAQDFWKFDPVSGTWSQVANFGGPARWGGFGFAIDGKGYAGCGRDAVPNVYNDLWEYDTTSNSWTQKSNFPGAARRGCVGAALNGKGYVGMGWNGTSYYDDWYEYDPSNDTWTQKANWPGGAMNYPCATTIGDKVYVGTGYSGAQYLSDFFKYDQATDSWISINACPGSGRYGAGLFSIGQYMFLTAGGMQTSTSFTDTWRYDTVSGNWQQMADLTGGVRYCVAYSLGKYGYVAMGDSNNAVRNYIWRFDTTNLFCNANAINHTLCASGTNRIDYTVTDSLAVGNTFYLEMSDSNGDFANAIRVDSLNSNVSGQFNFTIPAGYPPSFLYQVRVVSTNPVIIGYPSEQLSLKPLPKINIPGSTTQNICGSSTVDFMADTSAAAVNYEAFPIEIIYDASQGQSGLSGANKVYMHSGTADNNTNGTPWYNVVGNWGQDDGIGQMTSMGNNKWKITLDVAKYYNVGYYYGAKYLAMVFRNEDGSQTGKTSTGGDIFIDLQTGAVIGSNTSAVSARYLRNYQWYNGTNAISGANGPVYSTNQSGDYSLMVSGFCNATSQTFKLNVGAVPNAGFTQSAAKSCAGQSGITFSDTTTTGSGTRMWDFGDGKGDTAAAPNHIYANAGNYNVKLISGSNGCYDTAYGQVVVNLLPTVSIGKNSVTQCQTRNDFNFADNSSVSGGSIASHFWKLGDGSTATTGTISHRYTAAGNYTLTLISTTADGCFDSAQLAITVHPSPNQKMYIDNATQCLTGNNFNFIDSSSISAGSITGRNWNFGDGNVSNGTISPSHSYSSAGTFGVLLISSTNQGCTDTLMRQVTVLNKPTANVSPSGNISLCQGQSITLRGSKYNGPAYQWLDGNNAISGANSDSLIVSSTGAFKLAIVVSAACADTSAAVNVTVNPKPAISPISGASSVTPGSTQTYSVTNITGVTFKWTVTQGTIISGQGTNSISVNWNGSGAGKVSVTADCGDTISQNVNITSGIHAIGEGVSMSLYPNPTNDITTLSLQGVKGNYIVRLIDMSGKMLTQFNSSADNVLIDMNSFLSGTYILEVIHEQGFMKQLILRQ